MSTFNPASWPLSPFERKAKDHAHIAFFAYLVAMPLGVLTARYARTFTNSWFWPHAIVNFVVTGPLVFTAFAFGYQATNLNGRPHWGDPHQKGGLALLILYLIQVFLGAFIHWIKIPVRFPGGRRPQNYLHAILGLSIISFACWQTHYGLWTEWGLVTGNIHPVHMGCKHFWLAIVIIVWALYGFGLVLLPRQFRQEAGQRKAQREGLLEKDTKSSNPSNEEIAL